MCKLKPHKDDPNHTHITIGWNQICYPGNVDTPTGSLELTKIIFTSVISCRNARFASFDISNFYLNTPINRYEYARVRLANIPDEFFQEYNLSEKARDGWIYFEIFKGVYGLPKSGKIANDILVTRPHKDGYYQAATTPGLWLHKWQPILFALIVDDFGIEYVGVHHALHLCDILT